VCARAIRSDHCLEDPIWQLPNPLLVILLLSLVDGSQMSGSSPTFGLFQQAPRSQGQSPLGEVRGFGNIKGGGIATTPSTRWSWTISGEHDQGAELTECIHGKREASPREKSSNTVAPTPMCSFGASSGCRGSSGGDRWHRGCHRTSQGIRPTYICPCSKDLGQPCRCT
jgi:hypothetical protein